ncbi:hypothetical protein KIPB_014350, partial [Kipferlia bialata]|eukprot:g14350.t1
MRESLDKELSAMKETLTQREAEAEREHRQRLDAVMATANKERETLESKLRTLSAASDKAVQAHAEEMAAVRAEVAAARDAERDAHTKELEAWSKREEELRHSHRNALFK